MTRLYLRLRLLLAHIDYNDRLRKWVRYGEPMDWEALQRAKARLLAIKKAAPDNTRCGKC